MIRKDFLFKFIKQDPILEQLQDKNSMEDDNYLLLSNRPIKEKDINKLPDTKMEKFVNKVLYDNMSNKLIYSSNYKKEMQILKKSQSIINVLRCPGVKVQEKKTHNIQREREKKEVISQAKVEIDLVKNKKSQDNSNKQRGNQEFYKEIIEEKKSLVSPEHKYRKDRFNKVYSNVKGKLDFINLPSVKLEYNDVYSRLYHNAVLTSVMLNQKTISSENNPPILSRKESMPTMRTYSVRNVLDNLGKEFTTKISTNQVLKCFSQNSGGPRNKTLSKNLEQVISSTDNQTINIIQQVKLNNGNFLLHDAVMSQKYQLIQYLIEKGCDLNSQNDDGNTPLHVACLAPDILGYKKDIINLLIENGADFTIKNKSHYLPIDLAESEIRKHLGTEIKLIHHKRNESVSRSK